jgi:hypothetical protein
MIEDICFCDICHVSIPESAESTQVLGKRLCNACKEKALGVLGLVALIAIGCLAIWLVFAGWRLARNLGDYFGTSDGKAVLLIGICCVGVGVIAHGLYSVYRFVMHLLKLVMILAGGVLAAVLIEQHDIDWFVAIPVCGLVVGLLCIPAFIVTDLDTLRRSIGKGIPR